MSVANLAVMLEIARTRREIRKKGTKTKEKIKDKEKRKEKGQE